MRVEIGCGAIELCLGDITTQETDAIVNAANSRLAGGGGVDGAIHARGGPTIMQETDRRYPDGCPTGSAVITSAGDLPTKHVLHTVGPVWSGGNQGEPELLASAYHACLRLAVENDCHSVAFPSLSTGAYGYPIDLAARISLRTTIEFLKQHDHPTLVRFVLFSDGAYGAFSAALEELADLA